MTEPKPTQWHVEESKGATHLCIAGKCYVRVSGPDREANARKFMHMDELLEAVEVLAADSRWVSGEPNFEKFRAILAKIDGKP